MKLERKKILITGGGSGIALELARRQAEANKVVIAGRDEAKLERAPRGGPELLVNNAGLFRSYPLTSNRRRDERPAEGEHDGNGIPTK